MGEWTLDRAIRYALNQHDQGMKLGDLFDELKVLREEGKIEFSNCTLQSILDDIDAMQDVDYLIYGNNYYFVYIL